MLVPFALEVYRRYQDGETVAELSSALGIPADRIEDRIRAAQAYVARHSKIAA